MFTMCPNRLFILLLAFLIALTACVGPGNIPKSLSGVPTDNTVSMNPAEEREHRHTVAQLLPEKCPLGGIQQNFEFAALPILAPILASLGASFVDKIFNAGSAALENYAKATTSSDTAITTGTLYTNPKNVKEPVTPANGCLVFVRAVFGSTVHKDKAEAGKSAVWDEAQLNQMQSLGIKLVAPPDFYLELQPIYIYDVLARTDDGKPAQYLWRGVQFVPVYLDYQGSAARNLGHGSKKILVTIDLTAIEITENGSTRTELAKGVPMSLDQRDIGKRYGTDAFYGIKSGIISLPGPKTLIGEKESKVTTSTSASDSRKKKTPKIAIASVSKPNLTEAQVRVQTLLEAKITVQETEDPDDILLKASEVIKEVTPDVKTAVKQNIQDQLTKKKDNKAPSK